MLQIGQWVLIDCTLKVIIVGMNKFTGNMTLKEHASDYDTKMNSCHGNNNNNNNNKSNIYTG